MQRERVSRSGLEFRLSDVEVYYSWCVLYILIVAVYYTAQTRGLEH